MSATVLIVSADAELVDDLLRLAAAADVAASVVSDTVRARSAWRDAALVIAGPDLSAELADRAPPRRPGVILATSEPSPDGVYRLAIDIGAQDVAPLPDAEAWLIERMAAATEPAAAGATTIGVIGGRGGAGASV